MKADEILLEMLMLMRFSLALQAAFVTFTVVRALS